jgi:hypothetical protein
LIIIQPVTRIGGAIEEFHHTESTMFAIFIHTLMFTSAEVNAFAEAMAAGYSIPPTADVELVISSRLTGSSCILEQYPSVLTFVVSE